MGFDLYILFLLASIRSRSMTCIQLLFRPIVSGHENYVSVDLRIYTRGVGVVRGALLKRPFIIKGKPIYIYIYQFRDSSWNSQPELCLFVSSLRYVGRRLSRVPGKENSFSLLFLIKSVSFTISLTLYTSELATLLKY